MRDIRYIIIHHTATPDNTTLESIRDYHVRVRGWRDIGYHYLIQKDGIIRLGRPEEQTGAHCKHYNDMSVGIAMIGNFESSKIGYFRRQQVRALELLVKDLLYKYPDAVVKLHRDLGNTLCPGKYLIEWIEDNMEVYNG